MIDLARDSLNPDLEWLGVMLNIADMRTRHSREAFDSLREHFGDKLIDTTIRASIAYAESAERALSILDYRPDLGADYLAVADELLRRLGLSTAPQAPGAAAGEHAAGRRGRRSVRRRPTAGRLLELADVGALGLERQPAAPVAQPAVSRVSASTTPPVCS